MSLERSRNPVKTSTARHRIRRIPGALPNLTRSTSSPTMSTRRRSWGQRAKGADSGWTPLLVGRIPVGQWMKYGQWQPPRIAPVQCRKMHVEGTGRVNFTDEALHRELQPEGVLQPGETPGA